MTIIDVDRPTAAPSPFMPSRAQVVAAAGIVAAFVWSYWPTLVSLEAVWRREADYSHGYLVAPLCLVFLWLRRDLRPVAAAGPDWKGLVLLSVAMAMRYVSARYYMDFIDGWTISIAVCGLVWWLCGREWLAWCWPAVLFLAFMVPLPYRLESTLSLPLQRIAAGASVWILQCCGFPAIQEGNVILLGSVHLEVERACSGLRMMTGVAALTAAYLIFKPMELWQRVLVIAAIAPIAMLANIARIVITAAFYQWFSGETAQSLAHDIAGWTMIPMAALLLWGYVRYTTALVIELEPVTIPRREL